mmetsp:Transcript_43844/g.93236  ORF Transcript_43844/g.93236 Transcript_43844/m.93236 type:complete len:309 (+) Transcript_43844:1478-2404(+)
MCPAPVRKATKTGAVSNGNGDAGGGGSRSMNRCSHVSAPRRPPSRVWSGGREDMTSAMIDMRPSVLCRNLSKLSNSPSLLRIMPRPSIKSSSPPPAEGFKLNAGMAMGQTVYRCPSSTGPISSHFVEMKANAAASGKPSPRVPVKPSACTLTTRFAQSRSRRYFLPTVVTGSPPDEAAVASSSAALDMASHTILPTSSTLRSSWLRVLIFPLTIFLNWSLRRPTDLDLSNSFSPPPRTRSKFSMSDLARSTCSSFLFASSSASSSAFLSCSRLCSSLRRSSSDLAASAAARSTAARSSSSLMSRSFSS